MSAETDAAPAAPSFLSDVKVIGLIGIAHFFSHFYILLLPPLFPVLKDAFGVSYVELGLIMTVFSGATAVSQLPFGYLVDRFGARTFLIAGLTVEAATFVFLGLGGGYWAALAFMAAAGIANGVYHPADYSILSASVSERRIGRAFSLHTFAGFAGFAVAPPLVIFLSGVYGWQTALILCGVAGLVTALVLTISGRSFRDRAKAKAAPAASPAAKSGAALLISFPILMCLAFYAVSAMGSGGINNFLVSALKMAHGVEIGIATSSLTGYLVGTTVGILIGGVLADRSANHNLIAALCFLATAVMIAIVGWVRLPDMVLIGCLALQGVLHGILMPSRDMIVRSVTPPGQFGKVFGFVTTGYSVGGIISPPIFGFILDQYAPDLVFFGIAAVMLVSMLTVFTSVRWRRLPAPGPA